MATNTAIDIRAITATTTIKIVIMIMTTIKITMITSNVIAIMVTMAIADTKVIITKVTRVIRTLMTIRFMTAMSVMTATTIITVLYQKSYKAYKVIIGINITIFTSFITVLKTIMGIIATMIIVKIRIATTAMIASKNC